MLAENLTRLYVSICRESKMVTIIICVIRIISEDCDLPVTLINCFKYWFNWFLNLVLDDAKIGDFFLEVISV